MLRPAPSRRMRAAGAREQAGRRRSGGGSAARRGAGGGGAGDSGEVRGVPPGTGPSSVRSADPASGSRREERPGRALGLRGPTCGGAGDSNGGKGRGDPPGRRARPSRALALAPGHGTARLEDGAIAGCFFVRLPSRSRDPPQDLGRSPPWPCLASAPGCPDPGGVERFGSGGTGGETRKGNPRCFSRVGADLGAQILTQTPALQEASNNRQPRAWVTR